jgi:hypothetical protein
VIFKLQRPISPPDGDVLIYNEDRSRQAFVPLSPLLKKMFRGSFKIYVDGTLIAGRFVPVKTVKDQPW